MKKFYAISGMTCDSCKSTIYQNLNEIPEIESIEVNLEKAEAIIFMKSNIEISKPVSYTHLTLPTNDQV